MVVPALVLPVLLPLAVVPELAVLALLPLAAVLVPAEPALLPLAAVLVLIEPALLPLAAVFELAVLALVLAWALLLLAVPALAVLPCTALSTEPCTRFNGRTTFYTYLILLHLWLYRLLWSCRLHFSQLFCKITSAFGTKLGIILNFTLTLWTLSSHSLLIFLFKHLRTIPHSFARLLCRIGLSLRSCLFPLINYRYSYSSAVSI